MAAGTTVRAQCDGRRAKAEGQPTSGGRWPALRLLPTMITATGQVYESLLEVSGKEAVTAVSPEEAAP